MITKALKKIRRKLGTTQVKDLHAFDKTVYWVVKNHQTAQSLVKQHGEILNESIKNYKTSDTLFILGSGPSINDITDDQWKTIKSSDSIGFNFWPVHEFVPSFFMFQPGNDKSSEKLAKVLYDKSQDYGNVPIIIRGSGMANGLLNFENDSHAFLLNHTVYYLKEYFIHPNCSIEPNSLFDYTEALGMLCFGKIPHFVPKWKTTMGLLLSFSFNLGYNNVILCGMDMKDSSHFWDNIGYQSAKDHYQLPEPGHSNIWTFTNKKISQYTIPDYVEAFNNWAKKRNDFKLFIHNSNTVLHPKIPIYF